MSIKTMAFGFILGWFKREICACNEITSRRYGTEWQIGWMFCAITSAVIYSMPFSLKLK